MDSFDLGRLAVDTFPWVGARASCVGYLTGDINAGYLGGGLLMVATQVPAYQKDGPLRRKFEDLIGLVDKACSWSPAYGNRTKRPHFATLKRIASTKAPKTNPSLVVLETEIQQSLKDFLKQSPEMQVLLSLIQECQMMKAKESPDLEGEKVADQSESGPSYPSDVNDLLYCQMQREASCECQTHHLEKVKLRLESEKLDYNKALIPFELLFHPSTALSGEETILPNLPWRETKIIVSSKKDVDQEGPKKKVRIRVEGEPWEAPSSLPPAAAPEKLKKLGPGEFCKRISKKSGSRLSFKIHQGALRMVDGPEEVAQRNVKTVEGMSLADLLARARSSMPKSVKIQIAYTIAKSVWQYYNSFWMSNPWTHENIYFLEERIRGTSSYKPHPYFAGHFKKHKRKIRDFYTAQDLTFNYPYVLALGMLLIEIVTGNPFKDKDYSGQWDETQINDYFDLAWKAAAQCNLGDSLVDKGFAAVLQNCLDVDLFHVAPFDEDNPTKNLEDRQSILYSKVVLPLEKLDNAYRGHWELPEIQREGNVQAPHLLVTNLEQNETYIEREICKPITDPVFLATDVGTGRWTPKYWLEQIDRINAGLGLLASSNPATPIKIAILDTGCNTDADFFSTFTADDERLDGDHWYDWVRNEARPIDEHGHGTAIVTLMLRMVRNAEIFVARVAKDTEGLQHAEDNIAEAILYATQKWNVDIISMSFGFLTEVVSIKNAIRKAEDHKNSAIVIFAAAANDGANKQEMFPASMESVISVRATNSNGSFVPAYDPPPSAMKEDSRLYGTLGEHVPYDWANEKLIKSGCSLATPIMAGITALIMEYFAYKAGRFNKSEDILKQIRTQRGVIQLFKEIAIKKGNQRFYVAPWDLFEKSEENRLSIAITALGKLPSQQIRK